MVGKRRAHKARPVYKKVVGTGLGLSELQIDNLSLEDASSTPHQPQSSIPTKSHNFPPELINLIIAHVKSPFNLLTINSVWFDVVIEKIYRHPKLNPVNFPLFVSALSQDRKLGHLVKVLDLIEIAQVGKNSMVSKLLHRCSPNLEVFVAPQSHFGYAPMVSLSHCHRLKALDLSLISEKVDLAQLFKAVQNFTQLETLYFPRSSIKCDGAIDMAWPVNLRSLGLSGGFPAEFLEKTQFPASLTELRISNCPYLTPRSINNLLSSIGSQLKKLAVIYPLVLLNESSLDMVFIQCPNLVRLQISVEYLSSEALDYPLVPPNHPLKSLILASSGLMGHAEKIRASDVLLATEYFPHLKSVVISLLLGWNPQSSALMGLVEALNDRGGGLWMS